MYVRRSRRSTLTRDELREYVEFAMEMRRRVKDQLKKLAGLEYWDTSFSYVERDSGQEHYVAVPESGGASLILEGTLPPGSVYTIGTDIADRRLAIFLIQSQTNRGSGRIIALGNLSGTMKEATLALRSGTRAAIALPASAEFSKRPRPTSLRSNES